VERLPVATLPPKEKTTYKGRVLNVENLPFGYIAYNVNTISPSSRWVSPTVYDSLQEQGLVMARSEYIHDKWRTDSYRPGVVAAIRKGDALTLRPDIFEHRAPEGSNTYGFEDPRITLMRIDGHAKVIVANVEVDGRENITKPTISTAFYDVENLYEHPWNISELTRVDGKDWQIEQKSEEEYVYTARPNEHQKKGAGAGRIVVGTVKNLADLKRESKEGFKNGALLEYPEGQELLPDEKEGGNQIILVGDGMLLLQHRARIKELVVDTGNVGENFEHVANPLEYVATAAYIPNLAARTTEGKIPVTRYERIASTQDVDLSDVIAKEWHLEDVLFTGGYDKGDILYGARDASAVAIPAPEWIKQIIEQSDFAQKAA